MRAQIVFENDDFFLRIFLYLKLYLRRFFLVIPQTILAIHSD